MCVNPTIDQGKCNGCGLCIRVCSCSVLVLVDDSIAVIECNECHSCSRWCNECEAVCPTGAIICPFEVVLE